MANRGDIALGAAAAAAGTALVVWIVPSWTNDALFALVSPQFYPLLSAWLLIGSGAGLVVSGAAARGSVGDVPRIGRHLMLVAAATACLGSAVAAMLYLGFVAAGAMIVGGLMLLAGERRLRILLLVPLAFPTFLWIVFDVFLNRPLP